jgi:large subunit ribosomal protein L6
MLNQKIIKLISTIDVQMCTINLKNILLIKKGIKIIYLQVPTNLVVKKNGQSLVLSYIGNSFNREAEASFVLFYSKLESLNVNTEKSFTKKLVLKGLGLKATLINQTIIEFKLGFSHAINVIVPKEIKVVILKNILIIESHNPILLGNFSASIKNLKMPDVYKGKGICYKTEILRFKSVKKT